MKKIVFFILCVSLSLSAAAQISRKKVDVNIMKSYDANGLKKTWSPYVQTDLLDSRSFVLLKTGDIDALIKALEDCNEKINGFIQE